MDRKASIKFDFDRMWYGTVFNTVLHPRSERILYSEQEEKVPPSDSFKIVYPPPSSSLDVASPIQLHPASTIYTGEPLVHVGFGA
jgi:hypothetical protein